MAGESGREGQGIEWSVPVLVRRNAEGRLAAEIPDAAVALFEIEEGDVVCFTAFASGAVEFWSIKKSPYTSLEDTGVAERIGGRVKP